MDTIHIKGKIYFEIRDNAGKLKDKWTVHNIITNTGKAALAGLAGNTGSVSAFTYLAVGTSSTAVAASQTALQTEITGSSLDRAAATVSRTTTSQTNDTLSLVYTWTASGSKTIEEVGVFNASSSGIMLGRALTTSKVMISGDTLTATYTVQFS